MKRITTPAILFILAMTPISSRGQIATNTSEAALNQKLLDNSAKAQAALDAKNANQPVQQIRTLGPKTINPETANLTDQDKQLSENYIHQGKANAIITENCKGDMASVCQGNEGRRKFLGMDSNLVKALSQAYAMFGAVAGDSLGAISKSEKSIEAETAQNTKDGSTEKVDKKATDYCKFIPTVTEGLATTLQMAESKSLAAEQYGNGDTAQKDTLLKAAKSHDSRAKLAQIQAAGWWGGSACYAVNAARGAWAMDRNLIIKMGAAGLLGAFYQSEVSANKEYAEKTRAIANKLPGKGDCNPITDNLCYCSQPSTENDPVHCLKGLHAKKIAATSYRVACTDNNLKLDPTCSCEQSNSCFDTYLENASDGALNLGLGYANSPFKSIRSLARGELVGGTLNDQSYAQTSAIARRGLKEATDKVPSSNLGLTKDQKGLVDAMVGKGIPATVATLMAQNPQSQGAVNAAMAKFSGATSGQALASVAPRRSNVVDFSGGNGLGYKGNKGSENSEPVDILSKLKPGGKAPANSKILEFAQKAEAQARQTGQIRKEETPLFEIISLRYQTSGRRLLEVDLNNN